jgi:hypothetical protein
METFGYPLSQDHGILVVYTKSTDESIKAVDEQGAAFYATTMKQKNLIDNDVVCAIFPRLKEGVYTLYHNDNAIQKVSVYNHLSIETRLLV